MAVNPAHLASLIQSLLVLKRMSTTLPLTKSNVTFGEDLSLQFDQKREKRHVEG